MSPQFRFVALVCIAVFAFTAITAAPVLALLDADIPVEPLFGTVSAWVPAPVEEVALPTAPAVAVHAPRPPPNVRHV
jgi:hypothetical protein